MVCVKELLQLTSPFSNSAPLMYSLDLEVVDLQRRKGEKDLFQELVLNYSRGDPRSRKLEKDIIVCVYAN